MQTSETSFHFAVGLLSCFVFKKNNLVIARNSENSCVLQREEVKAETEQEWSVIERALIKQTKQVFSPFHCH